MQSAWSCDAQCGHMAMQEPRKLCQSGTNTEEDPLWRHPGPVPAFPLTGIWARQSRGLRIILHDYARHFLPEAAAVQGCSWHRLLARLHAREEEHCQ